MSSNFYLRPGSRGYKPPAASRQERVVGAGEGDIPAPTASNRIRQEQDRAEGGEEDILSRARGLEAEEMINNTATKDDVPTREKQKKHTPQEKHPSNDWRYSQEKADLVDQLQDPSSAIRNMSIKDIYDSQPKYQQFKFENFYRNIKRLEKKHKVTLPTHAKKKSNVDGETKSNQDKGTGKEKGWRGSKAKGLLLKLLLDKKSFIHTKTDSGIYNCDALFMEFKPSYFQKNLKRARKVAAAKLKHIDATEAEHQREQLAYPPNSLTVHGYPRWPDHCASSLLKEDVKNGLAYSTKPKQLRGMRDEYQEFPLEVFRRHVHQEKRAQKEGPYWVHKMRKGAQRQRDKEARRMKEECEEYHYNKEVESLAKQMDKLNID